MNLKKSVQSLDLFSLPFRFSLGEEEKEKKTLFGGILSLLITILSLSYFIYLCYLYGANKIPPSIAMTEEYTSNDFSINLKSDFISLKVQLGNNQSLWEYQTQNKKVLMQAILQYVYYDANQQIQVEFILGVPCSAPTREEYLCFSLPSFKDEIPMFFSEKKEIKDPLLLILAECSDQFLESGYSCEKDKSIISDQILGINPLIQVFLSLSQYNTATKSYQINQRVESYVLDSAITFYSHINLQKSDIAVTDGLIIQVSKDTRLISGYSRTDSAMTSVFINTQLGVNSYGGISFNLTPNNLSVHIQFVQFTQLLAQFSSIFNSLLFLGFFSKLLAESEIAQEMISVQLKCYYKLTAIQLISLQNNKPNKEKKESINKESSKSLTAQLLETFKRIQNLDFKDAVSKQLRISFPRRIYSYLFQSSTAPKDSPELRVYKQLQQQASNALNIFQLQKEILTLKVMLRLVLSPEQFAAALLCGSNLPLGRNLKNISQNKFNPRVKLTEKNPVINSELAFIPKEVNNKEDEEIPSVKCITKTAQDVYQQEMSEDDHLNHLEMIDQIEENPIIQEQYLSRFLSSRNDSEINTRIIDCMIKSNISDSFQFLEKNDVEQKVPPPLLSISPDIEIPQKLISN